MKNILVSIAALFVLHGLQAQNTPWPSTGNVGIGTTTPGANLVVNGKARIISNLAIGVDGDGPSFFPLYLNGSNGASIGFNLAAQSADQKVWSLIANGNSLDRKSTRLNSSHANISYAVFCLKKKKKQTNT